MCWTSIPDRPATPRPANPQTPPLHINAAAAVILGRGAGIQRGIVRLRIMNGV